MMPPVSVPFHSPPLNFSKRRPEAQRPSRAALHGVSRAWRMSTSPNTRIGVFTDTEIAA